MKPRKSKIPAFIPNRQCSSFWGGLDTRNEAELRKQRENQKKLMLNNKNHKY